MDDSVLVETIMTKDVWTCAPDDMIEHAAHIMWERDCGVIPVVDQNRHVVGMITDRDVCMAAYTQGKLLGRMRVVDVMSQCVHAVRPTDTVRHVEYVMSDHQVRRLPIVDARGCLVGLVSLVDLARRADFAGPHLVGASGDERVARTLGRIGASHRIRTAARAG
jgi:CBS domain-containing protein